MPRSNTPSKRTKRNKVQSPISFQAKPVTLEDDRFIVDWEKSTLTEEKMKILSELFVWKAKQVELRREHK